MIGHHHKVSQRVALPVKESQGVGDDLAQVWMAQDAGAVTGVGLRLQSGGELAGIMAGSFGQILNETPPVFLPGINAMLQQPGIALSSPLLPDGLGNGVCGAPGDEVSRPGLVPVWEMTMRDCDGCMGIEKLKRHGGAGGLWSAHGMCGLGGCGRNRTRRVRTTSGWGLAEVAGGREDALHGRV